MVRRTTAGAGFTLLELMISMTIVALMVVTLFGGFRVGARAWEKGEKDMGGRQRQRIVLDLLRRQLASVCATEVLDAQGQPVLFQGDHKSMTFVSHVALTPGGMAVPVLVRLAVESDPDEAGAERLLFSERSLAMAGAGGAGPEEAEGLSVLLAGEHSIGFEYLKIRPGEASSPWREKWDPAVETAPPRAIRISLRENEGKAPVYVIAAPRE
jgi:general secretion pathway protein J